MWWSSNPLVSSLVQQAAGAARGGSVLVSCITFRKAYGTSQVATWKVTPFLSFRSGCQMLFVSCSCVTGTAEVWGDHDLQSSRRVPGVLSSPWSLGAGCLFYVSLCLFCLQDLGKVFLFFPISFLVVLLDSVSVALLWDEGRTQGRETTKLRGVGRTEMFQEEWRCVFHV